MKQNAIGLVLCVLSVASHAGWEYESSTDKMSGKASSNATVVSDNSLAFDFPYKGKNHGTLMVRSDPVEGLDVAISIVKGQMLCSAYDCAVTVKFDEGKPVKMAGLGAADHSSTVIFLKSPKPFIESAKKAKKVLVQFNAYKNGSPILEFTTNPSLVWPQKTK